MSLVFEMHGEMPLWRTTSSPLWLNTWLFSFAVKGKKYILKYIEIENSYFKLLNIFKNIAVLNGSLFEQMFMSLYAEFRHFKIFKSIFRYI